MNAAYGLACAVVDTLKTDYEVCLAAYLKDPVNGRFIALLGAYRRYVDACALRSEVAYQTSSPAVRALHGG